MIQQGHFEIVQVIDSCGIYVERPEGNLQIYPTITYAKLNLCHSPLIFDVGFFLMAVKDTPITSLMGLPYINNSLLENQYLSDITVQSDSSIAPLPYRPNHLQSFGQRHIKTIPLRATLDDEQIEHMNIRGVFILKARPSDAFPVVTMICDDKVNNQCDLFSFVVRIKDVFMTPSLSTSEIIALVEDTVFEDYVIIKNRQDAESYIRGDDIVTALAFTGMRLTG